ncbi:MAG: hypothetical protein WA633_03255, partial [Stellaceae bacterium]
SAIASLPTPTVLRGSPPKGAKPIPVCPPYYTLAPGYGCLPPSAGEDSEAWPGWDYWADYGWGYGYGWLPGFRRFHGFANSPRLRGFHRFASFHGSTFHGLRNGVGHMGGLGRR